MSEEAMFKNKKITHYEYAKCELRLIKKNRIVIRKGIISVSEELNPEVDFIIKRLIERITGKKVK